MKLLPVFAVIALTLPSAFAHDTDALVRTVNALAKWSAGGIVAIDAGGTDALSMLQSLATERMGEEEFTVITDLEGKHIPEVEGVDTTFGVLGTPAAVKMFVDHKFGLMNRGPTPKQEAAVARMFAALEKAGAVFGYAPYGSSTCGVSWPGLLIIDVPAQKIHEVLFVDGEC